jgi:hypothetical protein
MVIGTAGPADACSTVVGVVTTLADTAQIVPASIAAELPGAAVVVDTTLPTDIASTGTRSVGLPEWAGAGAIALTDPPPSAGRGAGAVGGGTLAAAADASSARRPVRLGPAAALAALGTGAARRLALLRLLGGGFRCAGERGEQTHREPDERPASGGCWPRLDKGIEACAIQGEPPDRQPSAAMGLRTSMAQAPTSFVVLLGRSIHDLVQEPAPRAADRATWRRPVNPAPQSLRSWHRVSCLSSRQRVW